jgi:hypothetical protein
VAIIVVPTPNTTITSVWGKSVADQLNGDGVWQAYTPSLAGNTGASTIGNGILAGRYTILGQKTCVGGFRFQPGSTTALNAGTVRVGLPVPAVLGQNSVVAHALWNHPAVGNLHAVGELVSATQVAFYVPAAGNTSVLSVGTNTVTGVGFPVTCQFSYEVA